MGVDARIVWLDVRGIPCADGTLRALVPGVLADVVGLVLPDGALRATRITC